jgi:flagellar protein FlbB
MASFGRPRVLGRIVLLIAIILALVVGGLVWFDFIGLVDAKSVLSPAYRLFGLRVRTESPVAADRSDLLEEERYAKRIEALQVRSEELDTREVELKKQDAAVAQRSQELDDRGKAIEDQEKSFNDKVKQYENRKANIDQNAEYLTSMDPDKAVKILAAMEDQAIIDVFRAVEEKAKAAGTTSLVSVWLARMPPERSAAIQRKMALKPSALE